jgi:hypothetical protein
MAGMAAELRMGWAFTRWASGFGLPATRSGKRRDGAYEFINWFLDGWAGAYLNRQACYSAVLDTAKSTMEAYAWAYWMEGKPATQDIKSPNGDVLAKQGESRDGGSYEARMGGIACWNAVMRTPAWCKSEMGSSRPDRSYDTGVICWAALVTPASWLCGTAARSPSPAWPRPLLLRRAGENQMLARSQTSNAQLVRQPVAHRAVGLF